MTRVALLGPANSIHLQQWARVIAARGHPLCVLTQHPVERDRLPAEAEVVVLPHRGGLGYFRNVGALRRALNDWRPDLLNAHYASGYGTTASFVDGWPTLLSVWGSDVYDFPARHALAGAWIRRNLRHATAIASTSHAMAAQVRRLVPGIGEVAVTPFGVDLDRFAPRAAAVDPAVAAAPDAAADACSPIRAAADAANLRTRAPGIAAVTIGIVKTLAPKYGVDLLLRAFAGLVAEPELRASLRLVVVGDGPGRASLEALAATLRIADRVAFVGAVDHAAVPSWLHRIDVFAAPSRLDSESFGVAAIEAGAAGLPVVVADVGGLPEVVRDGVTGLVVPREDVPALQAALSRLVREPALRARLGAAGRAHVAAAYGWDRCLDAMEAAWRRTLELAPAPR